MVEDTPLKQHAETHKVGGADPLDIEEISAEDINLADLGEKDHASLDDVTANQHHVEFVSADAADLILTHKNDADAHHTTAVVFNLQGDLSTGTKQAQVLIPASYTISKVKVYADAAPTGSTLIVDVNKNGTTIFTTQGNRPTIAIAGHADDSGTPDVTALSEGDRLSVDVDQVGSTVAGGNDLIITVIFV